MNDTDSNDAPSRDTGSPAGATDPHTRRRLLPDLSVLRTARDFRLLWLAGLISILGSAFTLLVAVPLQVQELTGSPLAVGLLGLAELAAMLLCALCGGALADRTDRRRMVLLTEAGLALLTGALLANALLGRPHVWLLYPVAAAAAALQGLQWPALGALVPRLVPDRQLPAAAALESLRGNTAVLVGPSLGGLLAAAAGLATAYALDLASFAASLLLLARLRPVRVREPEEGGLLRSVGAGLRHLGGQPVLLGTALLDLLATALALPTTLLPFLAEGWHARWALGLLYAAPAAGGLLAGATSGWLGRTRRLGRVALAGSAVWGAALAAAGWADRLGPALLLLAVAGAGNVLADAARSVIWNRTVPDAVRGRLAGVELLAGEAGATLGQLRAGAVAARLGARTALLAGGLTAFGGTAVLAGAPAALWRYGAAQASAPARATA
ncbi:MFS transporter [Kitasatospora viridis]|uniref:Putative MFS family arabinose efflux permease n=1 Tax=Kitasatospora viridis TaxID=281105 RepID=A0A561SED7_9ACTN|nr:MFS transporter [Kitasatospora viridis]TWF73229.1 putative MFS family arabinose efflux permease [Kitasatospora viridis]